MPSQCSGRKHYVFGLFTSLWHCVPNVVVNTISWNILDIFSPSFQHWCIFGQGWTFLVLGSKSQSSRSQWIQNALKCTFWPFLWDILKISTGRLNFTKLSLSMHLGQGQMLQFLGLKGQRLMSQLGQWSSGRCPNF